MTLYDGNGNIIYENNQKSNCKIIAHRGFHETAKQNTIRAFTDASDNGFEWLEVDIRKCNDGIYVMAHDATSTLYNEGVAVSVTFASSNYADIKNYTWDSDGKYKLCTLQAVFNTAKAYNLNIICDLKNGSNQDVMKIASLCGATDKVLLSYSSFANAYNDRELLLKYDNVPIRCIPSDYANFDILSDAISNPIYADVNASTATHYKNYLNIALTCGVPILFSGCTLTNTNVWQVLASGCMANADLNISYGDFLTAITNDYDSSNDITLDTTELSIAVGGSSVITAVSTWDSVGGYVYAYSENPLVATVEQASFGTSISATVKGVATGTINIVFFSGNGEQKKVSVTVS